MLDAWGEHPAVAETLKEASDALGEDIGKLIHEGPKEALALTTNTQPVMLVAGVAAWRVWRAEGGAAPAAVAGHSLGEYSALVASGALTLAQAAPLVRLRAAAMQEAVPVGTGAMAAILGLDAAKVIDGCAEVTTQMGAGAEVVEAVNFNDPGQTVIAGTKAAVEKACEYLKEQGAKRALPLPVSAPFHSSLMKPAAEKLKAAGAKRALLLPGAAPFHSSLMKPAAEKLRAALADVALATPQIPALNNVDVAVQDDAGAIRDALYRQAFGPVRWVECIRQIKNMGITIVIECGPGKVLTGMSKRIDAELNAAALYDPETLAAVQAALA